MAVYFVYRCHHGAPSEKHLRAFPQYGTVLQWAQGVFRQIPDRKAAFAYARELLGGLDVYSFGSMFRVDANHPERARVSDDHFVRANPGKANFLLLDGEELHHGTGPRWTCSRRPTTWRR